MILKPIAVFYGPSLALYGLYGIVFSGKISWVQKLLGSGSWYHVLAGIAGMLISSMIGQALYPKSTPEDMRAGRAWGDESPDNELYSQSIRIDIKPIKTRHNLVSYN